MIIAIMSDVFDEVREGHKTFSLQIKLEMVAEYAWIVHDESE